MDWKMVAKNAGVNAIRKKASAIGVVVMVCAVENIRLEMDVMVSLGGLVNTNAIWNQQVCCFLGLQNHEIEENSQI